jgi:hypothetical protein
MKSNRQHRWRVLYRESRSITWRLRLLQLGAFLCRDTAQLAQIRGMLQQMRAFQRELRTRMTARAH